MSPFLTQQMKPAEAHLPSGVLTSRVRPTLDKVILLVYALQDYASIPLLLNKVCDHTDNLGLDMGLRQLC
jgi:hypothetical protein